MAMRSHPALVAALSVSAFLHPALSQTSQNLLVSAPAGAVQGIAQGSSQRSFGGAARAFLGIQYAEPPVGDLRWKPPVPVPVWKGVRQATSFGSRCEQPSLYDDMIFRDPGPSEDCLTLNVWTPAEIKPGAHLPVMVWIYGGGFLTGGTSEPRQDGGHLATMGVIVVSFNYRLGIFGFLTHPDLAAESPTHAAGNYGLLDAVAALTWVRDNIAAFGGDPGNVTIFGESAGSFAVSALMASPLAHGLFVRAIGQSGGALGGPTLRFEPEATHEAKDAEFARVELHADSLAALRALPAGQLLAATSKPGGHFGPDVDGLFLRESPVAIFAAGRQNDVPLLAGWNHDEGGNGKTAAIVTPTGGSSAASSADAPSDLTRLHQAAEKDFGARAAEFLAAYPASTDAEALERLQQYATEKFIAFGTWKWLEAQTATGRSPTYRYQFDLAPPPDPARPGRYGVFHSDDIEYVFGNLDSRKGIAWRPEDYRMSEQMMTWWTNFARTGDPNGLGGKAGFPTWPVYTPASGSKVMHFDQPASAADKDSQRDQFLFLQSAWK
jgi:para-nitrobenzyl esterase